MSNLTEHQREILIAMLQDKKIEMECYDRDTNCKVWRDIETRREGVLVVLHEWPDDLRIAPGQEDKTVRLHGDASAHLALFDSTDKYDFDTHYIDINPETGMIIGGKL